MEPALKLKYFDSEVHAPSHYPIIYHAVVNYIEVSTQISIFTEFTHTLQTSNILLFLFLLVALGTFRFLNKYCV